TGSIVASVSGTYDIVTRSDDGVRLWLNGTQMINNWTNHGEEWDYATITLTAGTPLPFVMEFYDNNGGAMARLWWEGPGVPFQAVPNANLRPTSASPPPPAPAGEVVAAVLGAPEDLLKYAFGADASSGVISADRGLRIDRTGEDSADAVLLVPCDITDITYILEFSTDLIQWTPTDIRPVFTIESEGVWRITWPGVPPFVRVRVIHTGGVTAVGPPVRAAQMLAQH
ncbi:MAG: hypothetical protein JNG86_09675, partial [Verrucomicrobiaceae bacterium]|nr:hypothetical protein [Verrucomicrobiaceae bacterium]